MFSLFLLLALVKKKVKLLALFIGGFETWKQPRIQRCNKVELLRICAWFTSEFYGVSMWVPQISGIYLVWCLCTWCSGRNIFATDQLTLLYWKFWNWKLCLYLNLFSMDNYLINLLTFKGIEPEIFWDNSCAFIGVTAFLKFSVQNCIIYLVWILQHISYLNNMVQCKSQKIII